MIIFYVKHVVKHMHYASKMYAIYLQSTLRRDCALWTYFPFYRIHTSCGQILRNKTSAQWCLKTLIVVQENIWLTGLLQAQEVRGNIRKDNRNQLLPSFSFETWLQTGVGSVSDLNSEHNRTRKILFLFPAEACFKSFIIIKLNVEVFLISFI